MPDIPINDWIHDGLDLLQENDYHQLLRTKSKHIRGPMTWANVCAAAVSEIATALLEGPLQSALDACEHAHTLADRLTERDKHPTARVTAQLRNRINQLHATAACIEAAVDRPSPSHRAM